MSALLPAPRRAVPTAAALLALLTVAAPAHAASAVTPSTPSVVAAAALAPGELDPRAPVWNRWPDTTLLVPRGSTTTSISWRAPTELPDGEAIVRYEVRNAFDEVVASSAGELGADLSLIAGYGPFQIFGVYASGGMTPPSPPFSASPFGAPMPMPMPYGLTATPGSEPNSVTLSWAVAGGWPNPTFDVYEGVTRVGSTTDLSLTLTGLTKPLYRFRVWPRDGERPTSSILYDVATGATIPPPPSPPKPINYTLSGAVTLKTLATGAIPLSGTLKGELTGEVLTGDLVVNPGTAKLTAYGFLPVMAAIKIVPTSKFEGVLKGSLTATVKVRVKLPSVTLFGLQLGGGANCQSASVSSIALQSLGPFTPESSNRLAGTFPISNLAGCGALTGIISPLTAGPANAIMLSNAPIPVV